MFFVLPSVQGGRKEEEKAGAVGSFYRSEASSEPFGGSIMITLRRPEPSDYDGSASELGLLHYISLPIITMCVLCALPSVRFLKA